MCCCISFFLLVLCKNVNIDVGCVKRLYPIVYTMSSVLLVKDLHILNIQYVFVWSYGHHLHPLCLTFWTFNGHVPCLIHVERKVYCCHGLVNFRVWSTNDLESWWTWWCLSSSSLEQQVAICCKNATCMYIGDALSTSQQRYIQTCNYRYIGLWNG